MLETHNPQGQQPEETGQDLWVAAEFETSVRWDEEAVEEVRDAMRAEGYPYIDQATAEEVMRLAIDIWFPKSE